MYQVFPWAPCLQVQAEGKKWLSIYYGILFLKLSLNMFMGLLHELKLPCPPVPQGPWLLT